MDEPTIFKSQVDEYLENLEDRIQRARDLAGWKEEHGDIENATMRNDWANGMRAALDDARRMLRVK